ERIAGGGLDLRDGGVDVDVHRGTATATLRRDAVDAGEGHEEVGLAEESGAPTGRGAVLHAARRVDEDPALAEPEPAEEVARRGDPVRVLLAELVRPRVVRRRVVPGVLVEPDVVAERAETEQIVRRLPRVAAERIAHEVP